MSEWLNTTRAAELLGLSEASVRRLGDRGLLPVRRVGRRRERRFQAGQVERFKRTMGATRPPASVAAARAQVLLGGVPMDPYTHLAVLYDSDAGRFRVTVPFLEAGLRAGQPCFLVAHGLVLESYLQRLGQALGTELDAALKSGRLTVLDAPGTTVEEALEFWEKAFWSAMETGPSVIRAVGEMVPERERFVSEAEMLAYEAALNSLVKRFPCFIVCQYDVREFSGPALYEALRAHPDLFSLPLRTLLS